MVVIIFTINKGLVVFELFNYKQAYQQIFPLYNISLDLNSVTKVLEFHLKYDGFKMAFLCQR